MCEICYESACCWLEKKGVLCMCPNKLLTQSSFPDGPVGWTSTVSIGKQMAKEMKTSYLKG